MVGQVADQGVQAFFIDEHLKVVQLLYEIKNEGYAQEYENNFDRLQAGEKGKRQQKQIPGNGNGRHNIYDIDKQEGVAFQFIDDRQKYNQDNHYRECPEKDFQ